MIPIKILLFIWFLLISAVVVPEHWMPHLWLPSIRLLVTLPLESCKVTPSWLSVMIFSFTQACAFHLTMNMPSAIDFEISLRSIIVDPDPLPPNAIFAL
jgi:hypothetical protein